MVNRQKFQEFDAVMQLYVSYKRTQKAEALTFQACNVSALQGCRGGRQGFGGRGRNHGRGGQGGPNACLAGLPSQDKVDKVTTIEAKWYPPSKYSKFTPTKKQKHYQLMNKTKKTQQTSATVAELTTAISAVSAVVSTISELTAASAKRTAAKDAGANDNTSTNLSWGWNRDNLAAAGRQDCVPKNPKNRPTGRSTLSAFQTTRLAIDPKRYVIDLSTK
jgi:hypothetical protein